MYEGNKRLGIEDFSLCDFCEYDTGPYKEKPIQCQECKKHKNFKESARLSESARYIYEHHFKN
jgi:hypothetical protein